MPSRRAFIVSLASLVTLWPLENFALGAPMEASIWISDPDGMNLQGTVEVRVTAAPTTNLLLVQLYVDNILVQTSTTSPLSYQWNTNTVTNGTHILRGDVVYKKRRSTTQIAVTVNNGTPPPPNFPASYFTGPLGSNNVVPNSNAGALVCLWSDNRTTTAQRATDLGRALDCVGIHYGGIDSEIPGRGGSNLGSGAETWVHQQGSIPIVSWMHNRFTKGTTNLSTMQEVNNGLHDACITEAANYWKNLNFRVMWRLCWEFDGNWFPWSPRSNATSNDGFPNPGCTSTEWITAWRRIVGLVQSAGADNVGFFWCPTEANNSAVATSCYPGNAYVDWVGSDCYNQASATVQTSPLHAGWAEFWECFNYTGHGSAQVCKHDEFGPSKPFFVGETSSLYDSGDVNRKANWFRNIQAHANAKPDMPYLCGVQIFDNNLSTSEGFDWRVDRNQTYAQKQAHTPGNVDSVTYQGFKDWAASPTWNVGVAGGAT